jgi:diguanylate cyclase (GGDEF)-like protein
MKIGYPLPTPQAIDDLIQQAHNLRLDNTRLALQISQQARAQALQINYQRGLAYSLYLSCLCHFILADEPGLLEKAFQALSLFEGLNNKQGAAQAHNLLALIYERQDKFKEALEQHRSCLTIRQQVDDRAGQSASLNNIALVYRSQENYAQALEYLFEALKMGEASSDPHSQAYALANIAAVYVITGEFKRAMAYAQRGLELNRQANNRALDSTLLTLSSKISYQFGEYDAAVDYLNRSLEISRQTGNLNDEGDALLALGRLYQNMNQHAAAREKLDQALHLMRQLGSRLDEAEVLGALGKGCLLQGDYSASLDLLTQALQAAQEAPSDRLVYEIQLALSQVYEAQGDFRLALEHFRAYHQVGEKISGRGAHRRVQELTSEWEKNRSQDAIHREAVYIPELSYALKALQEADEQKSHLISRLAQQAELLEHLAREDGLTGLLNRRWLDLKLAQEIERANRFGHALSVAMLDLDNFKQVNDCLSHQVGDAVLIQISALMRENFRTVDIVGRYGGEEFMVILVETTLENAHVVCERLRQRTTEYPWQQLHPQLERITLSIGVTSYRLMMGPEMETPEHVAGRADEALYRAKRQGKNQVCAYG